MIALPTELRRKLSLDAPGAQVQIVEREDGVVELVPQIAVPASQAYFWTQEWQTGEHEVDELVAKGDVETFDDVDAFAADLAALGSEDDGE